MKILKFLHASNFQLHLPVTCWSASKAESDTPDSGEKIKKAPASSPSQTSVEDAGGVPEHLPLESADSWTVGAIFPILPKEIVEECLAAAWLSAQSVFELAIRENVDFILLTGDVIEPELTGARGMVFLAEQFRRLQERGISVYWKLERSIERCLLPDFHFPENVFLFPSSEPHIKKFRLAESTKNIFIASWSTPRPDFSHYDFSKLANGKLPFAQTIAICPDESVFWGNQIIAQLSKKDSAPSSEMSEKGEEKTDEKQLGVPSKKVNSKSNSKLNLNKDRSFSKNDDKNKELSQNQSADENQKLKNQKSENQSVENQSAKDPSVVETASVLDLRNENFASTQENGPIDEVAYVALTASLHRSTSRKECANHTGQMIFHSPGEIQYRSPEGLQPGMIPQPAGVTIVNQDLDGDVPTSLQFFSTETIGWRFPEKRLPSDVDSWEKMKNWLVSVQEEIFFTERNESTSEFQAPTPIQTSSHSSQSNFGSSRTKSDSSRTNFETEVTSETVEHIDSKERFPQENEKKYQNSVKRTFVYWKLFGEKPAQTELLRTLFEEGLNYSNSGHSERTNFLLDALRSAAQTLAANPWSVLIQPDRSGLIPYSWGQTESMLGDFLRLTRFHAANPSEEAAVPDYASHSLDLAEMLNEPQLASILGAMVKMEPEERETILEMASILGADAFFKAQEGGMK